MKFWFFSFFNNVRNQIFRCLRLARGSDSFYQPNVQSYKEFCRCASLFVLETILFYTFINTYVVEDNRGSFEILQKTWKQLDSFFEVSPKSRYSDKTVDRKMEIINRYFFCCETKKSFLNYMTPQVIYLDHYFLNHGFFKQSVGLGGFLLPSSFEPRSDGRTYSNNFKFGQINHSNFLNRMRPKTFFTGQPG